MLLLLHCTTTDESNYNNKIIVPYKKMCKILSFLISMNIVSLFFKVAIILRKKPKTELDIKARRQKRQVKLLVNFQNFSCVNKAEIKMIICTSVFFIVLESVCDCCFPLALLLQVAAVPTFISRAMKASSLRRR